MKKRKIEEKAYEDHISIQCQLNRIILKSKCDFYKNSHVYLDNDSDLDADIDDMMDFIVDHDVGVPGCVIRRSGLSQSEYDFLYRFVKANTQRRMRVEHYNFCNGSVYKCERVDLAHMIINRGFPKFVELDVENPHFESISDYFSYMLGNLVELNIDLTTSNILNSVYFIYVSKNVSEQIRSLDNGICPRFEHLFNSYKSLPMRVEDSVRASRPCSEAKQVLYGGDRFAEYLPSMNDMIFDPMVFSVFRHFIDHKASCMLFHEDEFDTCQVKKDSYKAMSVKNIPTFIIWHLIAYRFKLPFYNHKELFEFISMSTTLSGGLMMRFGFVNYRISTIREQVGMLLYLADQFDYESFMVKDDWHLTNVFYSDVVMRSIPPPNLQQRFLHGIKLFSISNNIYSNKFSVPHMIGILNDIVKKDDSDVPVREYIDYHVRISYLKNRKRMAYK